MIRRSRISVRPNVKPTIRPGATSRETSQGNEPPAIDAGVKAEGQGVAPEDEAACTLLPSESNDNAAGSQIGAVTGRADLRVTAGDMSGQSASAGTLSTRRKRFSVLPNLSKPRNTPSSSTTSNKHSKSPVRSESTPEIPPASTHIAPGVSGSPEEHESAQESAPELLAVSTKPLRSPAFKLPSSAPHTNSRDSNLISMAVNTTEPAPDKTLSAPEPPPGPVAPSEGKPKRKKPKPVTPTPDSTEATSSRLDEVNSQPANQDPAESSQSDPGPVSKSRHINQDRIDLTASGSSKKPEQHVPLALRTLNDPADRLRLARARKLRELLKKEMNKEKQKEKHQRPQTGGSEIKNTKDHTKMTMRDLIYYLPSTNPMKSYTEDEQTDFPSSPQAAPAVQSATEQHSAEQEEDEELGGEEEEPMLAPRVKVAEDGSLIIDEESLTVRVQRMKGPNPVEDRDPIFERGSTTTYSSFRKGTYTKPWSNRETDMFFLAISMVGTDFSMIGQLFPHRARIEIKNKFKKEERANSWRIDKAFKEKQRLDLDFFNKLLAQILKDEEERRKKKKKKKTRASPMDKIPRRRPGERKRKIYSSDSEEDESSGSDAREGEREKENVCDDGGISATAKRKRGGAASPRRSKHANQSEEEVEGDAERSVNKDASPVIELDSAEEDAESFGVKPVRRWRDRGPVFHRQSSETRREENNDESDSDTPSALVLEKKRRPADVLLGGLQDSEDEEEPDLTTIQEHILNKPTRSGRIPKLSQHIIRAAADEEDDEEEEQLPPLPHPPEVWRRGSRGRRGRSQHVPRRGQSRLVTLRASPTEDVEEEYAAYHDEENEFINPEEENQAFVPRGLRSVTAVQAEVEETMEELDISVNVPDILGISQDAVCPEQSCERALAPLGSVPCEHQLNLLVDVIEFLTPDHMEVSEEAARTLLTIGHSAHVSQSGQTSSTGDIIIVEDSSSHVHEEVLVETTDQSQTEFEPCVFVTSDPTSETAPVRTVITGDESITQAPPHDSASMAEPVSSQERTDFQPELDEIQPETFSISAPEPALLPKQNLCKTSRSTAKDAAETPACSAEPFSTLEKGDEEVEETQLLPPEALPHPEPQERVSEICEEKENDKREECGSVVSLEKKTQDGGMGEEMQQAQSKPIPSSMDSECSVKTSQPLRRCRGPKPKPNLVRSVRSTHTVSHTSQNLPAVPDVKLAPVNTCTDIQQPDEGAHVVPEPERGTPKDPVTVDPHVIPDADPEELPPSSCEPLFILSLTEVLPTFTEGAGPVVDPLPLSASAGSLFEPISTSESPSVEGGGTGPAGDRVFSQLFTDALIPVSEERGAEKEEPRRRENSPLMQISSAPEEPDEPPVEPPSPPSSSPPSPPPPPCSSSSPPSLPPPCSSTPPSLTPPCSSPPPPSSSLTPPSSSPPPPSSSSSQKTEKNIKETELPGKRRKLPESSRRVHIKPNPIPRRTCRELPSSDETASVPASSPETPSDQTEPNRFLTEASSSTTSPPHVSIETPPPQTPSSSCSQGDVEIRRTDPVDPSGARAGAETQQNTPPGSTGVLTRPGRRPKGFLSFMCGTSAQRPSESSRVPQKHAPVTRRRATPSIPPPPPPPPPTSSLHVSSEPHTETSSADGENQEPTSVSAYFFNDIFTEVDEQGED